MDPIASPGGRKRSFGADIARVLNDGFAPDTTEDKYFRILLSGSSQKASNPKYARHLRRAIPNAYSGTSCQGREENEVHENSLPRLVNDHRVAPNLGPARRLALPEHVSGYFPNPLSSSELSDGLSLLDNHNLWPAPLEVRKASGNDSGATEVGGREDQKSNHQRSPNSLSKIAHKLFARQKSPSVERESKPLFIGNTVPLWRRQASRLKSLPGLFSLNRSKQHEFPTTSGPYCQNIDEARGKSPFETPDHKTPRVGPISWPLPLGTNTSPDYLVSPSIPVFFPKASVPFSPVSNPQRLPQRLPQELTKSTTQVSVATQSEPLEPCCYEYQSKIDFVDYSEPIMEVPRVSRFLDPTSAMAAITKHKVEAIRLAREQGLAVKEMCRRAKSDAPPYEFEELIGKGSYGRVYKGHQLPSRKVVAIKVMDIDSLDYKSIRDFRDESIKDFIHETKVMKQVKDSGAKNINELIEAISIHSQLWLVCEYCPGGSVRTLMRATGDRLDEKFIIPVARELAAGLRAIHDAGIIHRDIKAGNVLIHEEGRLQICDFGVAGVLQSHMDKRSTWIGTPHWMPPEMFSATGHAHHYGSEIDVWAYGCTLFEFATGNPPNSNLRERMQIGRQLNRNTPKLADTEKYSEGLRTLTAFAMESDPATRPTMADIMLHPYIADSEEAYPTSSLSELVRIYYQWSQRGGQRISLFHPGGAAAAEMPGVDSDIEEDWNFSTTDDFERRFSVIDLDQVAASLAEMEDDGVIDPTENHLKSDSFEDLGDAEMTEEDRANFDERVRRGAAAMEGLFNEEMPSYTYETKNDFVPIEPNTPVSDLPLRTDTDRSSVTSTFIDIDIGSFDSSHYAAGASSSQPFQLADADTIRANRSSGRQNRSSNEGRSGSLSSGMSDSGDSQDLTYQPQTGPRPPTMDWKFPVFIQPAPEDSDAETGTQTESESESDTESIPEPGPTDIDPTGRRATMEWTFPVMTSTRDDDDENQESYASSRHDTLKAPIITGLQPLVTDQPADIGEPGDSRPSTSASVQSSISASSDTDYDPFRFDRPSTPPDGVPSPQQHFADHEYPKLLESVGYNEYEQSSILEGPGPDEEENIPAWQNNIEINDPTSHSEPFPTAIPSRDVEPNPPFVTANNSPVSEPLPTARYDPPVTAAEELEPIQFPELVPPRLEMLMEDAGDLAVTAELDRLLGNFLDALSATGEALSRTRVSSGAKGESSSSPEKSE